MMSQLECVAVKAGLLKLYCKLFFMMVMFIASFSRDFQLVVPLL